jgi:hypothetical protein
LQKIQAIKENTESFGFLALFAINHRLVFSEKKENTKLSSVRKSPMFWLFVNTITELVFCLNIRLLD